jgi:hypothetical protein
MLMNKVMNEKSTQAKWGGAKCTQECESKIFHEITSQFVSSPLPKSLGLYCI